MGPFSGVPVNRIIAFRGFYIRAPLFTEETMRPKACKTLLGSNRSKFMHGGVILLACSCKALHEIMPCLQETNMTYSPP